MTFLDRSDAGKKLGAVLAARFHGKDDVLLFALPRGGVAVGAEVAYALSMPLEVIVTRKIGAPENPEFAIGALAETGEIVWNEEEKEARDIKEVDRVVEKENKEMTRRVQAYRGVRALPEMKSKTAIIVDDGIATGLTMRAAIATARHQHAERVIVAVPHGAADTLKMLEREADEVIALEKPSWYGSVGQYYREFTQLKDEEVIRLLSAYAASA